MSSGFFGEAKDGMQALGYLGRLGTGSLVRKSQVCSIIVFRRGRYCNGIG